LAGSGPQTLFSKVTGSQLFPFQKPVLLPSGFRAKAMLLESLTAEQAPFFFI
jgi:hypothetical protein